MTRTKPITHGTLVAYKAHGCRCEPCAETSLRYQRRRARLLAYGQWQPFVDAGPVREHILQLRAASLGARRLSKVSGVGSSAIARVARGVTRRVRPETAASILAVRADLDALSDWALTDASGTHRRIQAMATLGWSLGHQSISVGRRPDACHNILSTSRVTARTARQIRSLYGELWGSPAPCDMPGAERARCHAARAGWLGPLAWDDDLIDLPDSELERELRRRAELMDDDELVACRRARDNGDLSPLILAGSREYRRRRKARDRQPDPVPDLEEVAG